MNSLRAYLPSGSSRVFENSDIQISVHGRALVRLLSEGCGRISVWERKQDGLVLTGKGLPSLDGPVKSIRNASPQTLRHFTRFDQVNQLVGASEADPDLGFMARMMVLCSLPRTNPGNRHQYKRVNGPYKLIMSVTGDHKLPFGNLPRLLLAWVCTEAVKTGSRELVLGKSLSDFMRTLDIYAGGGNAHTKLRNQMKRLFGCTVSLIYEDKNGQASVNALIARPHGILVERAQA